MSAFHDATDDMQAEGDDSAEITAPAFDLELAGAGHFGEGADIHAVWAGVDERAPLRQLQKSHERAARAAGPAGVAAAGAVGAVGTVGTVGAVGAA